MFVGGCCYSFSLLLVVVQITLGRYMARVVGYVFLGWKNVFVVYLYLEAIVMVCM